MTFNIENHCFAIPIETVQRIMPVSSQTPYIISSHMPEYALCVAKFLEQPVIVIDLLKFLNIHSSFQNFQIVVLVKHTGNIVGLAAQSANVVAIASEDVIESACLNTKSFSIGDVQYSVLDIQTLLSVE